MPVGLLVILYPIVKVLVKVITGAVTAGLVYYFLISVVQPYLNSLDNQIYSSVSQFSNVGGTAIQVINYLDFPHCVYLLLSASSACFSIKIMSVAVRAFGINTGGS